MSDQIEDPDDPFEQDNPEVFVDDGDDIEAIRIRAIVGGEFFDLADEAAALMSTAPSGVGKFADPSQPSAASAFVKLLPPSAGEIEEIGEICVLADRYGFVIDKTAAAKLGIRSGAVRAQLRKAMADRDAAATIFVAKPHDAHASVRTGPSPIIEKAKARAAAAASK